MRRLTLALALLLSCTTPPPVTVPSQSSTATASSVRAATASPTATPQPLDLAIAAAGEIRGDHALVMQVSHQPGGYVAAIRFWDVPIDGSAPKQLIAYNQGDRLLTGWDQSGLSDLLSPDGRQLILADPLDIAGTGFLIADLIAGTTRKISIDGGTTSPNWSPDGQRIAYRGFTVAGPFQKESGIWVVGASGGSPQLVLASDRAAGDGATIVRGWTQDGKGILFSLVYSQLNVVEIATGKVTRIGGATTGIAVRAERPSVAIVVDEQDLTQPNTGRVGHVEVRDSALAPQKVVARYGPGEGTFLTAPRWNPTTDEILMIWACGQGVLARDELVIVDGVSGNRRVLPTVGCPRVAIWNTDGSKIIYGDLQALRVRGSDGSNDRELFRPGLPPGAFEQYVVGVTPFAPR
jgi:hypothetical protein